jgi:hypothetical protein
VNSPPVSVLTRAAQKRSVECVPWHRHGVLALEVIEVAFNLLQYAVYAPVGEVWPRFAAMCCRASRRLCAVPDYLQIALPDFPPLAFICRCCDATGNRAAQMTSRRADHGAAKPSSGVEVPRFRPKHDVLAFLAML